MLEFATSTCHVALPDEGLMLGLSADNSKADLLQLNKSRPKIAMYVTTTYKGLRSRDNVPTGKHR